nr:LysM peptidoglycan-binding domain-containing M23 family metallopeptidase [Azospirillum soli]
MLFAALLLLPLATACQRTGAPAPVTNVGVSPDSVGGAIIVTRGDTAYTLSRRYNVPLRDLIEVNRLTPPYTLEIGQRLVLPGTRQYVVQRNDTLYGISRMFNVDQSELTRINNMSPPYAVQVGQPLRLPGGNTSGGAIAVAGASPSTASSAGPVVMTAPAKQVTRGSVQATELPPPSAAPASAPSSAPGSSVSGPASTVTVPVPSAKPSIVAEVVPAAPAAPGGVYQPGQAPTSLRLPGQKPSIAAEPIPAPAPTSTPAPAQTSAAAPTPPAQEVAAVTPPKPDANPPPRGAGRFLWPVKGKLISAYGPKPDGMHNDGLNIAAAKGTAVVAADNGVVAYAGNELRGFGNLLLVKHADGFITAYAHLDRIDVERGAKVKRGQAIGTVGQTGSVTSPQLHFELRKGSQAVDPRDQMEPARVSEAVSPGGRQGPG